MPFSKFKKKIEVQNSPVTKFMLGDFPYYYFTNLWKDKKRDVIMLKDSFPSNKIQKYYFVEIVST